MDIEKLKEKFGWKKIVIGFVGFILVWGSFFTTTGTEYAVLKHPNGTLEAISKGGIHWKLPIFSDVTKYDMNIKTAYEDDDDSDPETHGTMKRITFTDTYGGMIGSTFIYTLNSSYLIDLHTTYHSQKNLIATGLKPISKQLLAYTANQFSGESFMQGAQNEYQQRVDDQANNGLYITKRVQEEVSKNTVDVGLKNENPKSRAKRKDFVYVTKIQYEMINGVKTPKRTLLPINKFGITLSQVTVDDFKPDVKLREFVERKQNQIAKRQDIIEKQENARQGDILAEAEGKKERTVANQAMLREKDAAVIQAQKKVELEQKEADMQVVRKQKDLDVQIMEKKVQKAKSEAAIYAARAIEATGLAKAKVKKAMYQAVRKDILILEVKKVTEVAKYAALKESSITLPKTVIMNGAQEGGADASLANLTDLAIMGKIDNMDTGK